MDVPITPLNVERTNGFFSNLGDRASLNQLRRFVKSAGLPPDVAPFAVESLGLGDYVKEKIEQLKHFFSDTRVTATQTSRIDMAVTELHCPLATGVEARLSMVRETEEKGDCSIAIFGIGGGDEYTTTFAVGDGLKTANGECIAAIYSIDAVFESCEIDTPDGQVRRFVRLKELVPNTASIRGVTLAGTADACRTANFDGAGPQRFDLLNYGSATYQQTLSLERGSKWKGEAKIKLEQLGIEFGASYEGSRTHKIELEYTLVGGFDYLAMKPQDRISWLWHVAP